ncbi:YbcC family protein [Rubellimicrobium roseum]|uniref:Probable inorganic carbon transporter subunit DabA n=1 Tax=Rubellimicrobium roseum TaxID=687525 RepID=A0A5C4NII4_9RHOB|nr:DUF2309 domain-containing protein [Rubellimicrobium roseum]TNC72229.1 DUF2309 domain-containing protein [Rubellimicrobium roseum]
MNAIADLRTGSLARAIDAAQRAVPPLFPLSATVAVNPFLGQAAEPLWTTAARMARVGGIAVTMPRAWYAERIADGRITDEDLSGALAGAPEGLGPESLATLRAAVGRPAPAPRAVPTVADLVAEATGTDWPGIVAERIGAWAAGWFDEGQALWAAPRGRGAYAAWRAVAIRDLTPEILGLSGFAAHVAAAPETAREALAQAVDRLGLPPASLPTYFHSLLVSLGGWAMAGRTRLWQAELGGGTDDTLEGLLAIRLVWEDALRTLGGARVADGWAAARAAHAEPVLPTADQMTDALLQEAAERAAQRELATTLVAPASRAPEGRPAMQAAFCIDVRSEVIRRALEGLDPGIGTMGFAGFFGLGAAHRRFASDVVEHRLPVLLTPALRSRAKGAPGEDRAARVKARAGRAWGRFKLAAVSSFAFVEATGPVYAGKLLRDSLGLKAGDRDHDPAPVLDTVLDLPARVNAAEAVLRAMSLTQGFARLVLLVGHGAGVTNNPHASALQCGACGGHSGEVNARLLAQLLNDPDVRTGLVPRGIAVPGDTLFVAGLHDTTADAVTLFEADAPAGGHEADVERARGWLAQAGRLARAERALRLPRAAEGTIARRSRDWAETRPEWALAGCKAFIAAPRARTRGKGLGGRAFLHDYAWREDREFKTLELILTAPVVVASWIGLQYYGSVVAPETFGAGNKLLHNVTGGIGVVEGNGGTLRPGLPWQSVHDGERLVHEPLRLSVCVEAPREAMTEILARHDGVRALFDNRWLHLFALDPSGRMAWRYAGGLRWEGEATRALALAG